MKGKALGEEILIANKDKELNYLQKQKLEELKAKEYIKRKGDANLIIPGEKTTVINQRGWVLEYMQKPKYYKNEIFSTDFAIKIKEVEDNITEVVIDSTDENFKVDDKVNIEYQGTKSIGIIKYTKKDRILIKGLEKIDNALCADIVK